MKILEWAGSQIIATTLRGFIAGKMVFTDPAFEVGIFNDTCRGS